MTKQKSKPVSEPKPLDTLVVEIRGHVFDSGRASSKSAKHQLEAGRRLIELRRRVEEEREAGQGVKWWDWYEDKFDGYIKSRKTAEKYMKWARADDPEAARAADKEQQNATNRERRKKDGDCANSKEETADPIKD